MHALHSLAHRAPPATRTRVRWQPYNSISTSSCSSIPSRSPSIVLPNTPSSVTPSPPIITPSVEFDRIRRTLDPSSISQGLKENNTREPVRNKYAIGLVDQAVKSLCEIWHPQDIPVVFLTSPRGMVGTSYDSAFLVEQKTSQQHHRNIQLPSPVSPSTQPSPLPPTAPSVSVRHAPQTTLQDTTALDSVRNNLVPIKGFVHEVLRRSRTSGCVLQTALCYLEAIRSKVPELLDQERSGNGLAVETTWADRITPATDAELAMEAELDMCPDSLINTEKYVDEGFINTIRMSDDDPIQLSSPVVPHEHHTFKKQPVSSPLAPAPPLPSPLLCPRRAFLASLILASKFTQDKCYSNRAWAKLSGLPPREIGRCERALGEALEWRLWVGKLPAPAASSSPAIGSATRPIVRSQSEHSLFSSTSNLLPSLAPNEKNRSLVKPTPPEGSKRSGLRRSSTLPSDAYVSQSDQGFWDISHLSINHPQYIQSPDTANPHLTSFIKLDTSPLPVATYMDQIISSPSPDTPGLSYSPSSTESSSGDRTIQMTTFPDDHLASFYSNPGIIGTETWPWLDNSDGSILHLKPPLSALPGNIKLNLSTLGPSTPTAISGWDKISIKPVPFIEPNRSWQGNTDMLLSSQ